VLDAEHFLPRKHQKMLLNLVDLERITVNDVDDPRNQIEALDINATPDETAPADHHPATTRCCRYMPTPRQHHRHSCISNAYPALLQDAKLDLEQLRETPVRALLHPVGLRRLLKQFATLSGTPGTASA